MEFEGSQRSLSAARTELEEAATERISPQLHSQSQGTPNIGQEKRLEDASSRFPFPFEQDKSSSRIKAALDSLPQDETMMFLVDTFESLERACVQGFTWRLIRSQLEGFRSKFQDGTAMVETSEIDVSFLSLLFSILSCAIEFCDPHILIQKGLTNPIARESAASLSAISF